MDSVTYFGHSCFLLEIDEYKILFDPFISPNELASEIDVDAIEVDYILVSHGHMDHVADLERIAKNNPKATLVSNYEIVSYYEQKGISGHPMNFGGRFIFPFGELKYVQAVHSSVLPDGTYGGNPGGFLIRTREKTYYYAGDTSLTLDMKLIPQLGYELNYAFLPIGDNFTMGIEEAALAAQFVDCENVIGMHYDTFDLIKINHEDAIGTFASHKKKLYLPKIGEKIEL